MTTMRTGTVSTQNVKVVLGRVENVPMAEGHGTVAIYVERRPQDPEGHGWTWFIYQQPQGSKPRPSENVRNAMKQMTKTRSPNQVSRVKPKAWAMSRTTELNAKRHDSNEYSAYKVEAELDLKEATDLIFSRHAQTSRKAMASGTRQATDVDDIFAIFAGQAPKTEQPNPFYAASPSTTTVQRPAPERPASTHVVVNGDKYTIDPMGRWHDDASGHVVGKQFAEKLAELLKEQSNPKPTPPAIGNAEDDIASLLKKLLAKMEGIR